MYVRKDVKRAGWCVTNVCTTVWPGQVRPAGIIKLLSNALRHVRELYRPNTSQQHLPYEHMFIPSKHRDSRIKKKKCIFSRPLQKIYGFFLLLPCTPSDVLSTSLSAARQGRKSRLRR